MASFGSLKSAIFNREEKKQQYQAHVRGLNAYDRHKKFLNDYVRYYGNEEDTNERRLPVKTDQDTLREGYRFIRTEEDDLETSWEQRLVKRYYDKLFKEYCIADMSHYKTGKIGMRWRTEKEVMSGKGQFICGSRHCDTKDGLVSYEVNFSYSEAGESKQALVKLVTCERCADQLHYKRRKEKEKIEKEEKGEDKKRKRRDRSKSDDGSEDEGGQERRRKEKKASISASRMTKIDDDDNFDEFLEGMFP
ncbi:protein FRA10AC1 [Tripterygium wilfordii]|uniref:Protein FRA10AC1 n=1 Tax=Tripterygium wilfordii TaxID=458696 RepID=A0A7J7DHB5_TRIWF|nr:protein FRA10AC1 [Tripterygium wilfordii]KAF5745634.1 protein FRA10AC1 [Tripterygium wilfordii]